MKRDTPQELLARLEVLRALEPAEVCVLSVQELVDLLEHTAGLERFVEQLQGRRVESGLDRLEPGQPDPPRGSFSKPLGPGLGSREAQIPAPGPFRW